MDKWDKWIILRRAVLRHKESPGLVSLEDWNGVHVTMEELSMLPGAYSVVPFDCMHATELTHTVSKKYNGVVFFSLATPGEVEGSQ